jgi:Tfp pilus assembly protein PilF
MTRLLSRWRLAGLLLLLVILAGLGVAAYFFYPRRPALPAPGTPAYEQYVEAFEVGVAALDADRAELATTRLGQAIDTIPQEPAAWADRGLVYLRDKQADRAAADLRRAEELAPDNGPIQALLGLLAQQQGQFAEAAEHYRKAIKADPQDLPSRYALAQVVQQEGGPDSEAEYQRLILECLQFQPYSLRLLHDLAVTAAGRGDRDGLRTALDRYRKLAPNWSPGAQAQLQKVEKAAGGPLPGAVVPALNVLNNLLLAEPGYTRSVREVEPIPGNAGRPLYHFVRLAPPPPTPAPPDTGLTFLVGEAGSHLDRSHWAGTWATWLTANGGPTILVADGREVRRDDADAKALPFPGGPKAVPPAGHGVVPFDWNNDFRTDLLLAGAGGLRFFQQAADGTFTDVSGKTGLGQDILAADQYGAWPADIEMDGDLDVVLAPRAGAPVVLRNNRDGTFTPLHPFPGVEGVRAFVWADFDNDGAPDAALLDAQGKVHVFANERSGQFRRRAMPDDLGRVVALAAADLNADGGFKLLALRADGAVLRLADRDKGQGWDVAEVARWPDFPTALEPGSVELLVADLDNNGSLDLVATTPQGGRVWLGEDGGKLTPLAAPLLPGVSAAVDFNNDGRLDLLALSAHGRPIWLVNDGTKSYHWQVVRPRASRREEVKGDDRINSFALGGEVELRSGTLVQKQLITAPQVHFGLGERPKADMVRLLWPNGTFQVEFEQPADQVVVAEQRLKGSCPFLFTWDGSRMRFVTDFMWSTPLGMYIQDQDKGGFLQTTDWVKIRSDQLVPRDGTYDVRVNANLWETHYYDYMALMAVDHPPGTEVWTDERFAVTPMVPQVYVTETPRPVARAWDDNGQDVTEVVRAADGRYLDTFGRGEFQGVTRDHWVEADLGDDAPREGPLWLLARGWVHPTDSSINKALHQGTHDLPRALTLEVPDGKGGWKVGRPALGFPAGKDKTMLIRLDGIDGPGVSRRFRLRTNMEIYWDALSYARPMDEKLARRQWLAPQSAELRFRGVLRITQANPSSPEIPEYDHLVSRGQYWRDLIGYYTRFGDVRELLAKVDDRYVIMNAGDEIALRFPVPDGPPAGWKRDFIWACDGWAKDGDLNTRFSKTVLPLPAHDLKTYITPPGPLEDDPVYRRFPDDWKTYHTRYVTTDDYERGLRPALPHRPAAQEQQP